MEFENPLDLNTKIISTKEIIEIKVHSRSLDNLDRIDLIVNDVITGTTEQENLLYEFSVNTPGFFNSWLFHMIQKCTVIHLMHML